MTYPIVSRERAYAPGGAACAWCKRAGVSEPNSMAVLSGGALLMNPARTEGGPSESLDAWLTIGWHGAHDDGKGSNRDIHLHVPIAEDVAGGQFDVYFCSTRCLRHLLNAWVDELERKMRAAAATEDT